MTWTIDGTDPRSAYGLVVSEIQGWADDVPEKYPTVAVPGVPGVVRTALVPDIQPRKLLALGVVIGVGATQGLRIADARTKLDGLRALLAKSALTVVMNDSPTRQLTADCEGIVVTAPAAMMVADRLPVQITLTCIDPYYYDTAVTAAGGSATFVVALGTAPTRPTISYTFAGPAASVVIRLTDAADTVTYGTITLTNGFIATDVLVVDMAARTVTLNGVSRLDIIGAGDFFAFDVATQGVFATSTWPTLRSTVSVTNLSYRKAWR